MLKLENSIRGLSFSRVAFDLTIQAYESPLSTNLFIYLVYYKDIFYAYILRKVQMGIIA